MAVKILSGQFNPHLDSLMVHTTTGEQVEVQAQVWAENPEYYEVEVSGSKLKRYFHKSTCLDIYRRSWALVNWVEVANKPSKSSKSKE